jgi:hypothetical protein
MTGSDFVAFLDGIFFDLANPGTADLPSLFFRLALLIFGCLLLWKIVTAFLGSLWRGIMPAMRVLWRVVTAPLWLPYRLLVWLWRPLKKWYSNRRRTWQERQRFERELAERQELQREREREMEEVRRLLDS